MIPPEEGVTMTGGMTEGGGAGVVTDGAETMIPHPMAQEEEIDMIAMAIALKGGNNMAEERGDMMIVMVIAMVMTDGNMIGLRTMVQGGEGGAIRLHEVGGAIRLLEVGGAIHLLGVDEGMNMIEVGVTILLVMAMAGRRETGLKVRLCMKCGDCY